MRNDLLFKRQVECIFICLSSTMVLRWQMVMFASYGEEETLDGFVGKYVIWEDELQKYKEKIKKVIDDE